MPELGSPQQEVRQPGVQRLFGHRPAVRGDRPSGVEGAQPDQQVAGCGQVGVRWRREPGEVLLAGTPRRKLQRERGQVGDLDLGFGVGSQRRVHGPAPEPVRGAGREPPRPTGALLCLGDGHREGDEAAHAAAGIQAGGPAQAGVDHHGDPLDGQARLRDGGRQHHLATSRGRGGDGRVLRNRRHRPVERAHVDARPEVAQGPLRPPDLGGAGQEHEHVAVVGGQRSADGGGDHRLCRAPSVRPGRGVDVHDLHREGSALGAHDGCVEQRRHRGDVEGGGHDDDAQVGAERVDHLEGQGEPEVGVEAALVELVEDHGGDARQLGVALEAPGQHALGDHLDAGARPTPSCPGACASRPVRQAPRRGAGPAGGPRCARPGAGVPARARCRRTTAPAAGPAG